jgi:hypothetical protein
MLALEFAHHLPYTFISSLLGMVIIWVFAGSRIRQGAALLHEELDWFFHVLHPMHLCLSAVATTSVFWRHEKRLLKAVLVGFFGTVIPCGLSDYIFPFIGGKILSQPMELHVCFMQHPMIVLPFVAIGIIGGLLFEERLAGSSVFSHGAHVFVSSLASLLYLASFGFTGWMSDFNLVFPAFLVVVAAVWIPCCISDIVVPVSVVHSHCKHKH